MRAILILGAFLMILPVSAASTDACAWQTSVDAAACASAGSWSQGAGDCTTPGSVSGGHAMVGAHVAGRSRYVGANNVCYAFPAPEGGHPYEGSQLAVQTWEQDENGSRARGVYLNSGVVHADDRDHAYCYVATYTEQGEDRDGPRLDCPANIRVPVILGALP